MLTGLYIQNLAVIEKAYIAFDDGLNVFTGETGAGKSIVIDAINAVLGQRSSKEIVRTGTDKASISAVFTGIPDTVTALLDTYGLEAEDGELILQRDISADGKSAARIGGRPVTASVLREIGCELINIHGQHDNQVLLLPERHIDILDNFAAMRDDLVAYQERFAVLTSITKQLRVLDIGEAQKAQRIDLLRYQLGEIDGAALQLGEDEALEADRKAIQNSGKILESLNAAYENLRGGDELEGALDLVANASSSLQYAGEYLEDLSGTAERIEEISLELQEIASDVGSTLDDLDFDPRQLDAIEERLDLLYKLKHKYGSTIEEILDFGEKAREELETIETSEITQNELRAKREIVQKECDVLAGQLHDKRKRAAKLFIQAVAEELAFLDMPGVRLEVSIEPCDATAKGADQVEFFMSTNPGEPPKPIAKIASGGELSRIMLAMKNALADKDDIPTLIFDEIDVGVSGRAAQKIGLKLRQAAKDRQIICVTHLAQIAALAQNHLRIRKEVRGERTYTIVDALDFEGRKQELARIMGTDHVTDLMLENAEQMLRMGMEENEQEG